MERVATGDLKIPKKVELVLDGPKEGETEKEKERRLLMNSLKSGINRETLKRMEEEAEREKAEKLAKEDQAVLDGQQSRLRVMESQTVVPEDLKPSPFSLNTEDVVANKESLVRGERFEKRADFDLKKEGETEGDKE